MNRTAQTIAETGLPGRPMNGVSSRWPKISGLPGRIAMRQKSSAKPCGFNALWTRSWSPTDAPPWVTMRSESFATAGKPAKASGRSGRMPKSKASPPQLRTIADGAAKRASGGRLADEGEFGAGMGVRGAHRIAIHRRHGCGRLVQFGERSLGQDPARSFGDGHGFRRKGGKPARDPRNRLV